MNRAPLAFVLAVVLTSAAPAAVIEDAVEMTPAAQTAIGRGLKYLADTQRADGAWAGTYGSSSGIVGACAIAFMGAGHSPDSGEHGVAVARSLRWLVRSAQPNGLLYRPGMNGAAMYNHGLATLALAEAWGMTQDKAIRDAVKRAVDLIVVIQNPEGGWRYEPYVSDADISSTVMQLMALRAADDAGIYVPKDVIDRGINYIKRCHQPIADGKDGGFAYQAGGGGSGFARSAAGVLSLQVAGKYRAGEVKEGIQYLLGFHPLTENRENAEFWSYGQYYAAMSIYQAQSLGEWGRAAWSRWYPAITNELIATQQPDGHWNGSYDQYPTAVAVLILSIPHRYLPIYQR
ncbi:MAG: terpene cyclase/mutase family protein [Planctomycetes bacterium]|nr:terpene cyclase/mutase family protein [Planctomycetota bacterium]